MLKSEQVRDVLEQGFHYITAITKPQIEKLLKDGVIQMGLFDEDLAEIQTREGPRYVLRRNPMRAKEMASSRADKMHSLREKVEKQNEYLDTHPRASEEVALGKVRDFCRKLRIDEWVNVLASQRKMRKIFIEQDENALKKCSKLDGCYVLKTDLPPARADKETIHARYKDLSLVESAFRTRKTVQLEMRPIHVRLAKNNTCARLCCYAGLSHSQGT